MRRRQRPALSCHMTRTYGGLDAGVRHRYRLAPAGINACGVGQCSRGLTATSSTTAPPPLCNLHDGAQQPLRVQHSHSDRLSSSRRRSCCGFDVWSRDDGVGAKKAPPTRLHPRQVSLGGHGLAVSRFYVHPFTRLYSGIS